MKMIQCNEGTFVSNPDNMYKTCILLNPINETLSRLKRYQNNAAKLDMSTNKKDQVEPILRHFYWLPVRSRIDCNSSLKMYNQKHPMISNLVSKNTSARFLHLSNIGLYSEINFKKLAIYVLVLRHQKMWNNLPQSRRNT